MVKLLLTQTDVVTAGPDQSSTVKGLPGFEVRELNGYTPPDMSRRDLEVIIHRLPRLQPLSAFLTSLLFVRVQRMALEGEQCFL